MNKTTFLIILFWVALIGVAYVVENYDFKWSTESANASVLLLSMVKNERQIIGRMRQSVLDNFPEVDKENWLLCDTGSTDGTQQEASEKLNAHVVQHKFSGLASNRQLCLRTAVQVFPDYDYYVFLDADHVVQPRSQPLQIGGDLVSIWTTLGSWSWPHPYIYSRKAAQTCSFSLERHEIAVCNNNVTRAFWPAIHVRDMGDGGNREEKFDTDKNYLLEKYYNDDNATPGEKLRAMFYIARTYEDTQKYDKALEWYQQRADFAWPGEDQEAFFSLYRMGIIHNRMNNLTEALSYYLQAYQRAPYRKEPLHYASIIELGRNNATQALLYASTAFLMERDVQNFHRLFFIDEAIYGWASAEQYAICLYRTGRVQEARLIWNVILRKTNIPEDVKNRVKQNLSF